jgi:hypothetical protein
MTSLDILQFSIGSFVLGLSLLLVGLMSSRCNTVLSTLLGPNAATFLALLLIGLGIGAPLAWSECLDRQMEESAGRSPTLAQIGAPQPEQPTSSALTDCGRPVHLSEFKVEINVNDWLADEDHALAVLYTEHSPVRTAPPDPGCNCHGWVFADGHYWVDGDDVPAILNDNGYHETTTPEVGDLIVYRCGGIIVHSGIVRETGHGAILIESKWGMNSRILHTPEVQPSWQEWQFYHTARTGGHTLRLPANSVPSKPVESPVLLATSVR